MTIRQDIEQIPLYPSMLPIFQKTISGYYLQGVRDSCVINKFTVSDHQGFIGKKATSSTVEDGLKEGRVGLRRSCKRSEEHTSELQSRGHLVCRLLLEKKKKQMENRYR